MTQHQLTIKASDLRNLVAPIIPFAEKEGMLPALHAVRLRVTGDWLTATATDRFRVGIMRHRLDSAPAEFDALVRLGDLKSMLGIFKVTKTLNPVLQLTKVTTDRLKVANIEGTIDGLAAAEIQLTLVDAEYVKVDKLIAEAITPKDNPATDQLGYNAKFLGDFQHVVRHGDAMQLVPPAEGRGATGVVIGDYFVGAIMPRRLLTGGEEGRALGVDATWGPLLGVEIEVPA